MTDAVEIVWNNNPENEAGFNAFDDIVCALFYGPSVRTVFTNPNPAYICHIYKKD